MKIIKPSATIMEHTTSPYEFIERVARTCYKSEDLITDTSAEKMVRVLAKSKHYAMLEHHTVYLEMSERFMSDFLKDMIMEEVPLSFFNITYTGDINILSGSFRSFLDLFSNLGNMSDCVKEPYSPLSLIARGMLFTYPLIFENIPEIADLKVDKEANDEGDCVLLDREEFIEKYGQYDRIISKHLTHTVKFVCDRGVSHEFVRHRVASFAQESTRYCNYSKDKHGNEITVIEPCFFNVGRRIEEYKAWFDLCFKSEKAYFELLEKGATPQEARSVLPNSLKTELIITATENEWQHIVNLRYLGTTGAPHPQIKEVMGLIIEDLAKECGGRIKYEAD